MADYLIIYIKAYIYLLLKILVIFIMIQGCTNR